MALPTVTVTGIVTNPDGSAVANATVSVTLSALDHYVDQYVFPTALSFTADASGNISMDLFPNALGENNTFYNITVTDPTSGDEIINTSMVVPNSATTLDSILDTQPATPYNTGLVGVQVIPFLDQNALYWSYMKNFNTASRTYTFPDASGTLPVMPSSYAVKSAEAFSGYVEMVDKDGVTRKFMVCQ